jgi:hypothetical protein
MFAACGHRRPARRASSGKWSNTTEESRSLMLFMTPFGDGRRAIHDFVSQL